MIIQSKYEIGDYIRVDGYGRNIYNIVQICSATIYCNECEQLETEIIYIVENLNNPSDELEAFEEDVIDDVTEESLEEFLSLGEVPSEAMKLQIDEEILMDSLESQIKYEKGVRIPDKPFTMKKENDENITNLINYQLTIIADYLALIDLFGEDVAYRNAINKAEEEIKRLMKEV